MSGLLLRLAGPLQSWGERSTFDVRDTAGFPTHSGLLGLLACVMGRRRGESLEDLAALTFTIRVDRPGTRIIDYQTAGGALPPSMKVPTADGKGRPAGKGTVQTWREYLADAVFVVAVQGPSEVLDQVRHALRYPHWQPYLGRRSCPPDQPLLLDVPVEDPVAELCTRVPLARRVRRGDSPGRRHLPCRTPRRCPQRNPRCARRVHVGGPRLFTTSRVAEHTDATGGAGSLDVAGVPGAVAEIPEREGSGVSLWLVRILVNPRCHRVWSRGILDGGALHRDIMRYTRCLGARRVKRPMSFFVPSTPSRGCSPRPTLLRTTGDNLARTSRTAPGMLNIESLVSSMRLNTSSVPHRRQPHQTAR